ncbi:hypothetical protein AN396_10770 [Candidatus Epulonipiscium fishelsonii]|uniref:Uncharacterized protein n=1 Tax=Candidatus Epulonipiscium fishelsonii TaxID=77094 RepID=A0ACC8X8H6_9FIRM|nr:hypothetical protein AN396_10770 [Epulopiscium sp. SCG-B11WGA-EpuloA1]
MALMLYNTFLTISYSVAIGYLLFTYQLTKKTYLCIIVSLFSVVILDNVIISMTENFPHFSLKHDTAFMLSPTFKTTIVIVKYFCYIYLGALIIEKKISTNLYIVMAVQTIILTLMPVLFEGALQAWLYYSIINVFTIALLAYYIVILNIHQSNFVSDFIVFCKISILIILAIIIEDSFVIFNFDTFTSQSIKIFNRNFSQDFLYLYLCVFIVKSVNLYLIPELILKEIPLPTTSTSELNILEIHPTKATKINDFCLKYSLTEREKDILKLLVDEKTNLEISKELFISVGTVKVHVHNIYQKVGVQKRILLLREFDGFEI